MKGKMALFCIILIVISSVLEIKAMLAQNKNRLKSGQKNERVSESPRETFYPQKVTVHVTWLAQVSYCRAYFEFVALACAILG